MTRSHTVRIVRLRSVTEKTFRMIEPDMQAWYIDNNIAFNRVPAHNNECEKIFKGNGPSIVSPANGTEYLINKKNPNRYN